MSTQMQLAREGKITEAMKIVAADEHIDAEIIRERVAKGTIAIPANINHKNLKPKAVGEGLRVKVNANIGTSSAYPDIEPELLKLDEAVKYFNLAIDANDNYDKAYEGRNQAMLENHLKINYQYKNA